MGVILALDPGQRRTGIAICDPTATLARPLGTHDRRRDGSLLEHLRRICVEQEVERILVGYPLTQMGERGSSSTHAETLAEKVRVAVGLPVELVDERYTSAEAQRLIDRRAPKGRLDAVAATLLLQGYLDERKAP